jgi:hypothetical protein
MGLMVILTRPRTKQAYVRALKAGAVTERFLSELAGTPEVRARKLARIPLQALLRDLTRTSERDGGQMTTVLTKYLYPCA